MPRKKKAGGNATSSDKSNTLQPSPCPNIQNEIHRPSTVTSQDHEAIFEQIQEMFVGKVDAEVVHMVLSEAEWKVEEALETLFTLAEATLGNSLKPGITLSTISKHLTESPPPGFKACGSSSAVDSSKSISKLDDFTPTRTSAYSNSVSVGNVPETFATSMEMPGTQSSDDLFSITSVSSTSSCKSVDFPDLLSTSSADSIGIVPSARYGSTYQFFENVTTSDAGQYETEVAVSGTLSKTGEKIKNTSIQHGCTLEGPSRTKHVSFQATENLGMKSSDLENILKQKLEINDHNKKFTDPPKIQRLISDTKSEVTSNDVRVGCHPKVEQNEDCPQYPSWKPVLDSVAQYPHTNAFVPEKHGYYMSTPPPHYKFSSNNSTTPTGRYSDPRTFQHNATLETAKSIEITKVKLVQKNVNTIPCESQLGRLRERMELMLFTGQKVLIMLRGCPGSGKSTLARQLKFQGVIFSTDDFFMFRDKYMFDFRKLNTAHNWNQKRAKKAFEDGKTPVIIDNTNVQAWEMLPYVTMGLSFGYETIILEPDTPWKFKLNELTKRNSHGVPRDKIKAMLDRYEHNLTVEKITGKKELARKDKVHVCKPKPPNESMNENQSFISVALPQTVSFTEPTINRPETDQEALDCIKESMDKVFIATSLGAKQHSFHPYCTGASVCKKKFMSDAEENVLKMEISAFKEELSNLNCDPVNAGPTSSHCSRKYFGEAMNSSIDRVQKIKELVESNSMNRHEKFGVFTCSNLEMNIGSLENSAKVLSISSDKNISAKDLTLGAFSTRTNLSETDENNSTERNVSQNACTVTGKELDLDKEFDEFIKGEGRKFENEYCKQSTEPPVYDVVMPNAVTDIKSAEGIEDNLNAKIKRARKKEKGTSENSKFVDQTNSKIIYETTPNLKTKSGKNCDADLKTNEKSILETTRDNGSSNVIFQNKLESSADKLKRNDIVGSHKNCHEDAINDYKSEYSCDKNLPGIIRENYDCSVDRKEPELVLVKNESVLNDSLNNSPTQKFSENSKNSNEDKNQADFERISESSSNAQTENDNCPDENDNSDLECEKIKESKEQKVVTESDLMSDLKTSESVSPTEMNQRSGGCDVSPNNVQDAVVTKESSKQKRSSRKKMAAKLDEPKLNPFVKEQLLEQNWALPDFRMVVEHNDFVCNKNAELIDTEFSKSEAVSFDACTQTLSEDFALIQRIKQSATGPSLNNLKVLNCHANDINTVASDFKHSLRNSREGSPSLYYKLKVSKGSSTHDLEKSNKKDDIEFLHSCFPEVSKDDLTDVLEKCMGDTELAINLLLDSGIIYNVPSFSMKETALYFEDISDNSESSSTSDDKYGNGKVKKLRILCEEIIERCRLSTVCSEVVQPSVHSAFHQALINVQKGEKETGQRYIPVKPFSDASSTAGSFSTESDNRVDNSQEKSRPYVQELNATHTDSSAAESSNGLDNADLVLELDSKLADQLQSLFGNIKGGNSSRSVKLSYNLALALHQAWTATVDEFPDKSQSLTVGQLSDKSQSQNYSQMAKDEQLARFLQDEEERLVRVKNEQKAKTTAYGKMQPHVKDFRQIMEEEQILEEMKQDEAYDSPDSLAIRMKRQKLYDQFPGIDQSALEGIFQANSCDLGRTMQAVHTSLGETEAPKLVMSPAAARKYAKYLDDKEKEESECDQILDPNIDYQSYEEPDYDDYRGEAAMHVKERQECFQKAQDAHRRGMKQVATFYAQQGHLHTEKLKQANTRASEKILESKNAVMNDNNNVDLHGLHVSESLNILDNILSSRQEELRLRPDKRKMYLDVITGRGNRSKGGVAKIKPAVVEYLKRNNYRFSEPHPGMIKVFFSSKIN